MCEEVSSSRSEVDEGEGVDRFWYRQFFGERYLEALGRHIEEARTIEEVGFVEKALGLEPKARILDLCCGHGRHSIELAARGYSVVGLDFDAPALGRAKEAAETRGVEVEFVQRDMRDIPFSREFDACINMFTAFGYLESEEEDLKVLQAVAEALKRGGKFLLDVINREWLMRNYQPQGWLENPEGGRLLEEREFDLLTSRNNVRWIYIQPDGSTWETHHSLRVYTLTELAQMLKRAGLRVETVYGGFHEEPYTIDSRRLIILALNRQR